MYLYGASGHAKVIMDIIKAQGDLLEGIVDDNILLTELMGHKVLHSCIGLSPFIVSIGNNEIRKQIVNKLKGASFSKAIHPSAIISETSKIGNGSVVMQGAIIQSCVSIGNHCIINTGSSIDHECIISDYVHISPHSTLCGNVAIGEGTWIGAGTIMIPGVKIGKWCTIGAGSVVTKDIPDGALAVGNRCKIIKVKDITRK